MNKLAIMDIGSNSIKMILVDYRGDKSFRIIDELKETVRLGEGMHKNSYLKEDRIQKALQTLTLFKNLCDAVEVDEIIAVATAAVREAANQQKFLDRVYKQTGLEIRVLAGKEEAYYDYKGVVNSFDLDSGLIMDVGGGSVELVLMEDRMVKKSVSLPFGALTITEKFELYDENNRDKDIKKHLHQEFSKLEWLKNLKNIPLIGVGGTIRNIAKIWQRKNNYSLEILHYYNLNAENVNSVYKKVSKKSIEERKEISGLSSKRADIFIGASGLVNYLMDFTGIENLIISGKGIREGLVYDFLLEDKLPVADVLDYSIKNLLHNFDLNEKHAARVNELNKNIFYQLESEFSFAFDEFPDRISRIIKTAALLHDVGTNINYYDHHEHSFYVILNADLYGLTHRELLLAAYISASHRHNKYSLHKYNLNRKSFKDIISRKGNDKELIRKSGIILEISESLDLNRKGLVQRVEVESKVDHILFKVYSSYDLRLEIEDAMEAADGFESLFGKELKFKLLDV
ncbi:Ppx/GppA phosphatase [Halanaerobium congolense]|uniref:Exopolyphosphatase n=1 Tax=Halanaerobium congolense TaxID=54121 RepID=A0A1G8K3G8_9FIRM|nr:exopolyphosphatase [Halanaerobium congolense]OEG63032.1 MAG: exopolyphosphatase [Halanaerobium sp. MDAL1]SDI37992.1 Ppx/GppA phosphatase [Halanaerobium congolense]SET04122.1 Ppx/GppA phosphatase [Halanaerobium congolense]